MSKLKQELTEMIQNIAGVTKKFWPTESGGFNSFVFKNKDFAHFHVDNELDLRLPKRVIAAEKLKHPQGSKNHPDRSAGSPWMEFRFDSKKDINEIYRLVIVAIKDI